MLPPGDSHWEVEFILFLNSIIVSSQNLPAALVLAALLPGLRVPAPPAAPRHAHALDIFFVDYSR